jgi:uroporphyrinogen decarboxylase
LIAALERKPITGRVPHIELVFFLTMEAFGKVHPNHRRYYQWDQMEEKERQLHRIDMADLYIDVCEKYEQSSILIHPNPDDLEETIKQLDVVRERCGDKYYVMLLGDPTFAIPDGERMMDFSFRMADDPDGLKQEADQLVKSYIDRAEKLRDHGGLDGFALCSDYCLNTGPFMSPNQFSEFVAPYLAEITKAYRDMGFYVIKHTDGNIMPIVDQIIQTNPHALHSIDPQAGVDIAEVKRLYGDRVCLIGNVNCGLLQTGTDEEVIESARYALKSGMPGGGYVFATSNCIYTGMPLSRYDLMLDVWRKEGVYA